MNNFDFYYIIETKEHVFTFNLITYEEELDNIKNKFKKLCDNIK